MGRLSGKVAIVSGSATGIGAGTARLMAKEGAKVVLGDINIKGAEGVAAQIRAAAGDAFAFEMDVSDETAVQALVAATVEKYGGVDVLFNICRSVESGCGRR